MKSLIVTALLGVAALAAPAHAQIAAAIGKPLPAPDLAPGTVSVRIVAGKVSEPVVGTDVTLIVNGTPRQARTDAAGRASFTNLPVGAKAQAKVTADDKDVTSEEFEIPADGGDRLLLSTKPFQAPSGGGGDAPFAGGGGGMPEPRQLSGEPRPEATDQPGTFTVRLTYDDLADKTPPVGVPVYLVGYRADDSVVTFTAKSDAAGRAVFTGLDRGGATSYFAMAQLARGEVIDRLVSTPAVLDSRSGIRLILSAEKRDSKAPAVDDLGRLEKQDAVVAPGKVRIALQGVPEQNAKVELVAMKADGSKRTIATVGASRAAPNPQDIQGQAQFTPKQDIPAHGLRIQVHGGPNADEPLGGVAIRLVPQSVITPDADLSKVGTEYKTPDGGMIDVTDDTKEPLIASITINGKQMQSQPIDLAKTGGVLDIEAHWDNQGKLQAEFDVTGVAADEVLFAQSKMRNTGYRSVPFQPVAARGSKITLYIYPRIMFSFSLTSHIDDEFLAVGGRFDLTNNSWAPYVGGTDGLVIPLPAHFKGARVNEQDQDDVAVAQGEGFRIGRPIPPGGKQFHGQFSLPVEAGRVDWNLDLPLGAFQSGMEILQTPGMSVQTPSSVRGQVMTVPQGTFYVLPQISILPHQSMQMTITNLPSQPAWKTWAPRVVGIVAILLMLGGLGLAIYRTSTARAADSERTARRSALLDELVELEKRRDQLDKKEEKRRIQIQSELEALWVD